MSWIPSFFRRNKLYSDLNEEIRLHIEERAEQLMSEGVSRAGSRTGGASSLWQSDAA